MEKKGLNGNALKLLAIGAMTIDHIAWAMFPGYPKAWLPILLHLIGRITCPIMCFFIAEGFHYTHDIRKYTGRLFGFAILSHFCYVFASADFAGGVPSCRGLPAAGSTRPASCGRWRGGL